MQQLHSKNLQSVFEDVFKQFQESTSTELSQTSSPNSSQKEDLLSNMQEKLKSHCPPEYYPRLTNELFGMGPIEEILKNENITEIIINGRLDIIYEEKGQLFHLPDSFLSDLTFQNFIHRISEEANVVLDLKQPFADGKWRQWRLHIIRRPIVNVSFHISFRRHPENPWTLDRLKEIKWAPERACTLIEKILKEKNNILIIGSTGSGKTSLLNACLQNLPPKERIITIEDSDELKLPNNFSTKLLTRVDSAGALSGVSQTELVRQSLRMRPDRIVMGEARGTEAKDLLMALATGHKGSLGTLHAKDHKQALWRLEMLVQMGAPSWDTNTIRRMIVLSIDYIVVLGRHSGERKLMSIHKLTGVEETGFLFEALYTHLSHPDHSFSISRIPSSNI